MTSIPNYMCGLNPQQRATGSLCSKQHCQGCAPYRAQLQAAAARTPTVSVALPAALPAVPSADAYISRLEHEVLMARAEREAYRLFKANRRDLFIAAAAQGLFQSAQYSVADVARIAVEAANAICELDPRDGEENETGK